LSSQGRNEIPFHLVAELKVRDPALLLEYGRRVQPVMRAAGGEIVATSASGFEVREGSWEPGLLIIHRWRSRAAFEEMWESETYKPIRQLRHDAAESRIVTFESEPPEFGSL
jgi:uncharacterized protein (DUF1330 family)